MEGDRYLVLKEVGSTYLNGKTINILSETKIYRFQKILKSSFVVKLTNDSSWY